MPPLRQNRPSEQVTPTSLTPRGTLDQPSQRRKSWARRRSLRVEVDSEDDSSEELQDLLKTTWSIYRVSPLFNCIRTPEKLKQYGLHLKNWLVSSGINVDVVYKANFEVPEDSENDSSGLKVTVECSLNENHFKVVYFGYFVSWKLKIKPQRDELFLPLLLCKGGLNMKTLVHQCLSKFFDCYIIPYHLSTLELLWLNGLFATLSSATRREQTVLFCLVVPGPWKDNRCELQIHLSSLLKMWRGIRPVTEHPSTLLTIEEVTKFYDELMKHVMNICPVYDLTKFEFTELKYPHVFVSRAGRLRCSSALFMDNLLSFLCNESVLIEDSVVRIGHESICNE